MHIEDYITDFLTDCILATYDQPYIGYRDADPEKGEFTIVHPDIGYIGESHWQSDSVRKANELVFEDACDPIITIRRRLDGSPEYRLRNFDASTCDTAEDYMHCVTTMVELLNSLSSYPLLCDNTHSDIEWERNAEHLESWAIDEALEEAFPYADPADASDDLREFTSELILECLLGSSDDFYWDSSAVTEGLRDAVKPVMRDAYDNLLELRDDLAYQVASGNTAVDPIVSKLDKILDDLEHEAYRIDLALWSR